MNVRYLRRSVAVLSLLTLSAAMDRRPPGAAAAKAAAPGDAIGWDELKDLVRRDEADNPEHWRWPVPGDAPR